MSYGQDRKAPAGSITVVILGVLALALEAALFVGMVQTLASA